MLRVLSHRSPVVGMLRATRLQAPQVTVRFTSTSGGSKPSTPSHHSTAPSTTTPITPTTPSTPTPVTTTPPPTPLPIEVKKTPETPKQPANTTPKVEATQPPKVDTTKAAADINQQEKIKEKPSTPQNTPGGADGGRGEKRRGAGGRILFYGGLLVAAAVATEEVLDYSGVFSTRAYIKKEYGIDLPLPLYPHIPSSTPVKQTVEERVEVIHRDPVPGSVAVELSTDPLLVSTTNQSSIPIEIVPATTTPTTTTAATTETSDFPAEVVELIPVEVIEIVQESPQEKPLAPPPTSAEEVLTELLNEITENTMPIGIVETQNPITITTPSIDFQALLTAQAEQIDALRERLQQYYTESNQAVDYKAKATETAYREALELRERVYRKELEEKLAQLQAEFDKIRQHDRNEVQAHFQQQFEHQKAENERKMEEALKVAVENVEAQYHGRLAEEINKFDSKLTEAIAFEDAKYNEMIAARSRAVEHVRGEVAALEVRFINNAAKLKESHNLHNVSSALFELGMASLAAPTRTSFKAELDKLEETSKGDVVVSTVADVLRPIAAVGVASYSDLTSRFKTVLASGRQAALVPEGGGVMGNLVAAVASKLIIPAKGPVTGDTPEAIFAKAEYYLERGELGEVVEHLSKLRGMPASIVRDWLQSASDRLTVENSLKALHAHYIVLVHEHDKNANTA